MKVMQELQKLTFAVQHNPNCPDTFLVRLIGSAGVIDYKHPGETADILGYGKTFRAAATMALKNREERRRFDLHRARRQLEMMLPGIAEPRPFPRD